MISKYPAPEHAQKLVGELVKLLPQSERGKVSSVMMPRWSKCVGDLIDVSAVMQTHGIFLQGSPTLFRDDTDRELPFRE